MGDTLPDINKSELDRLRLQDIETMKSCEVWGDGKYQYTIIVPRTDYIRLAVANLGMLSNAVGGLAPEEVIENARARPKAKRKPKIQHRKLRDDSPLRVPM